MKLDLHDQSYSVGTFLSRSESDGITGILGTENSRKRN